MHRLLVPEELMSGEAIAGFQDDARYVFSRRPDEVAYLRRRAEHLLSGALALLRTFDEEHADELEKTISDIHERHGGEVMRIGEDVFRNIDITVLPGHYALVQKHDAPTMSFLIEHPLLIAALEAFSPALPTA